MSAIFAALWAAFVGKLTFKSFRFWHFVLDAAVALLLVAVSRFRPLTVMEWVLIGLLLAHHGEAWLESLFAEIDAT